MNFSLLTIILIITVLVSLNAMNNANLKDRFMFIPYNCKHYNEGYRIFSHILIHADYVHLLFNMMSLYMLGKNLEYGLIAEYGFIKGELHFLMIYVLGAMFASVIPFVRHQDNSYYRSLGASGAVSAVVFATILWFPKMPLTLIFLPIDDIPAYVFGGVYLLLEYFLDKKGNTGIAHDAHLGGAVLGIIYVLIINIDKGKELLDLIF